MERVHAQKLNSNNIYRSTGVSVLKCIFECWRWRRLSRRRELNRDFDKQFILDLVLLTFLLLGTMPKTIKNNFIDFSFHRNDFVIRENISSIFLRHHHQTETQENSGEFQVQIRFINQMYYNTLTVHPM